jgi:hypothetical protein
LAARAGAWGLKRPRHKFGAVRTEHNGREYASKAEARYAAGLDLRKRAGEVLFWLEQVPMKLVGKTAPRKTKRGTNKHGSDIKYVVDFVVFTADGEVHFVDVKGADTDMSRLKRAQAESLYPVTIEVVK